MDTNQTPNSPDGDSPNPSTQGATDVETTSSFTQEEVDKIVSKRLAEAKAKADKQLAEEKANWERQSKLTEEERAKEAQAAKEAEMKQREREVTLRERRMDAVAKLAEKKLPASLVDFVVTEDAEQVDKNIDTLTKAWNGAIEEAVKARMAGNTPKDTKSTPTQTRSSVNTAGTIAEF